MKHTITVYESVEAVKNESHANQDNRIGFIAARLSERVDESPVNIMRKPQQDKNDLWQLYLPGGDKKQGHKNRRRRFHYHPGPFGSDRWAPSFSEKFPIRGRNIEQQQEDDYCKANDQYYGEIIE
jgi:hypothetical protein